MLGVNGTTTAERYCCTLVYTNSTVDSLPNEDTINLTRA